jgi:hypothetical protein
LLNAVKLSVSQVENPTARQRADEFATANTAINADDLLEKRIIVWSIWFGTEVVYNILGNLISPE